MKKINTIDVHAKEWFDKVNGNSYFSANVCLNFGMPDQTSIKIPFQYGYGTHYQDQAFKELQTSGLVPKHNNNISLWRYCEENKIILRTSKDEKCLKRDVIAYGQG